MFNALFFMYREKRKKLFFFIRRKIIAKTYEFIRLFQFAEIYANAAGKSVKFTDYLCTLLKNKLSYLLTIETFK